MTKMMRGKTNHRREKHSKGKKGREGFSSHESCMKLKGFRAEKVKPQPSNHRLNTNVDGLRVIISKSEEGGGSLRRRIFFKKV